MTAATGTRGKTSVRRLLGAALAGSLLAAAVPAGADSTTQDLDLRLFKTSDIAAPGACSLRLWQADRDPHEDRFAHVFLEDIDYDHMRAPARIRIGDEVVGLRRVAVGGTATGYDLYPVQLYRSEDGDTRAILNLAFYPEEGEVIDVERGDLTVIRSGHLPFQVSVLGGAGCMTR